MSVFVGPSTKIFGVEWDRKVPDLNGDLVVEVKNLRDCLVEKREKFWCE